jgi:hypothetical protein
MRDPRMRVSSSIYKKEHMERSTNLDLSALNVNEGVDSLFGTVNHTGSLCVGAGEHQGQLASHGEMTK